MLRFDIDRFRSRHQPPFLRLAGAKGLVAKFGR